MSSPPASADEQSSSPTFSYVLAAALIEGMVIAWSPMYLAVSVAQAGILLTGIMWTVLGRPFRVSRSLWPIGLIAGWGLLQILLGTTRSQWLTRQSTLTWFACGVAFLLASTILSDDKARSRFFDVIFWACTVLALIAMLQLYSKPVMVFGLFPAEASVVGTFLYKNQFAAMLELAAPIALYRMLEVEGQQWMGAIGFAIMFGAAVGATSRSGVFLLGLELIVALLVAAKCRLQPFRELALLGAGVIVVAAAISLVAGTQNLTEHFLEKSPYSVRKQLLLSTMNMVKQKPVFGYGLGTWPEVYPAFATFDSARLANEAHNDWAQWAAEGGIPFALLLAGVTLALARPAILFIWPMGLVAVMMHSLVDYPTREPVLAIFWFVLAGALTRRRQQVLPCD